MLRMPKNSRLYFTNFTIYFAVIVTSRWSRPDFRSLIQWIVPRLFFLFTDAPHTLIPRQWWYMGWLIGSIVCIEITKTSHNANHLSYYKMSHNTTKISRQRVKCVRFSSRHDWDFVKTSQQFRRFPTLFRSRICPKMFRRLLNTSEAIQKTTILACFDLIMTQSHLLASFLAYFRANWSVKEQFFRIFESGVRNNPWCVRSMCSVRRRTD